MADLVQRHPADIILDSPYGFEDFRFIASTSLILVIAGPFVIEDIFLSLPNSAL